jgi:Zn-dependent protease
VEYVRQIVIWGLPVVAAIVLHEVSHGYVAFRLGDSTAKERGRLTLNPLSHVDPIGTIVLPALLILAQSPFVFGYAKPVPVNFANLRNPLRDMIWVGAAGPLTNLALAVASAVLFHAFLRIFEPGQSAVALEIVLLMLRSSVLVNVVLATFNLLPILPLDGGRILTGLLPLPLAAAYVRLERYGMLIVVVLLATDVLDVVLGPVIRGLQYALLAYWA